MVVAFERAKTGLEAESRSEAPIGSDSLHRLCLTLEFVFQLVSNKSRMLLLRWTEIMHKSR